MEIRGEHVRYFLHDSFVKRLDDVFHRLAEPDFFRQTMREVHSGCETLHSLAERVSVRSLPSWSDQTLCVHAQRMSDSLQVLLGWGLVPALVDVGAERITLAANAELSTIARKKKLSRPVGEYFSVLTSPLEESLPRKEELSSLALALEFQEREVDADTSQKSLEKRFPDLFSRLQAHAREFAWTYFGYSGPALTPEKTLQDVLALSSQPDLKTQRGALASRPSRLKTQQDAFRKELDVSENQLWNVFLARQCLYLKTIRRDAMFHSAYALDLILREVSKRTDVALSLLRGVRPSELEAAFSGSLHAKELSDRKRLVVYQYDANEGVILFSGDTAERFSENHLKEADVGDVLELRGQCGCPGQAKGIAKIVDTPADMARFNAGDVLVSLATMPDIVPAMKKASAIVTNVGGITSHAAIVSRELNVPCVIGTKIATKVFKDGDRVEVNATEGWVRKVS
ncbi:hypothetical protein HY572_06005 [Candidatus Micrarchaeota archaeon]|nr:hypothetical protein [Candidatus Micrarchaeota archaeon]